ncbi:ArsR family transcriptional regulator, partial [cyanobacterium TDX16]
TPERLWEAITDPEQRPAFHFGNTVESSWATASPWALTNPGFDGGPLADGENVEVDPPRRLVQTMTAHWSPDAEALGATTVTWEIEAVGDDSCHLRLTHEMPEHAQEDIWGGWPMVLSGVKTYLETGETLTTPGSLMYG